jgi:hypothetical protein
MAQPQQKIANIPILMVISPLQQLPNAGKSRDDLLTLNAR